MKLYFIILLFPLFLGMCSTEAPLVQQEHEKIYKIVDSMPRFPGCEDIQNKKECSKEKIKNFISQNLKYPLGGCIEGTVVIRFVVEKDGSRSNYEILRNLGGGTGSEALKVVQLMPKWIPGKHQGKIVRTEFTMPVKFRL